MNCFASVYQITSNASLAAEKRIFYDGLIEDRHLLRDPTPKGPPKITVPCLPLFPPLPVSRYNSKYNISHAQKLGASSKSKHKRIWERDSGKIYPMFVFIYYRWENFCHWQFKWQAANLVSICFLRWYLGLHWIRAECLRWVVQTLAGWRGGKGSAPQPRRKIRSYFCFKCVSVHIWSWFFGLYTESRSGDPWPPAPETEMILAASLWV